MVYNFLVQTQRNQILRIHQYRPATAVIFDAVQKACQACSLDSASAFKCDNPKLCGQSCLQLIYWYSTKLMFTLKVVIELTHIAWFIAFKNDITSIQINCLILNDKLTAARIDNDSLSFAHLSLLASLSDSSKASMSFSLHGPFTFLTSCLDLFTRVTFTWVIPPLDPIQ